MCTQYAQPLICDARTLPRWSRSCARPLPRTVFSNFKMACMVSGAAAK